MIPKSNEIICIWIDDNIRIGTAVIKCACTYYVDKSGCPARPAASPLYGREGEIACGRRFF